MTWVPYSKLHVSHLLTLAARNQNCFFGVHGLAVCSFHLFFCMSNLVLRQIPSVVGSGSRRKDETASPIVTSVGSFSFQTVRITRGVQVSSQIGDAKFQLHFRHLTNEVTHLSQSMVLGAMVKK